MVHGVVMSVCNLYFMFFGKGEPAEWTKSGYGAKVSPTAPPVPQAPPRSHPREGRFSMRLNDKVCGTSEVLKHELLAVTINWAVLGLCLRPDERSVSLRHLSLSHAITVAERSSEGHGSDHSAEALGTRR